VECDLEDSYAADNERNDDGYPSPTKQQKEKKRISLEIKLFAVKFWQDIREGAHMSLSTVQKRCRYVDNEK